jgi:flagellar assembly protein FliH
MSARLIKSSSTNTVVLTPLFAPAGLRIPAELAHAPVYAAPTKEVDADHIIEEALARATRIEQEATQNAHALVQTELEHEITRTIDPWREQLTQTLDDLDGLRASLVLQTEKEVARLAIEIAKKVVNREVTIDNDIVITLARIGLSRMHNRIAATLHLHPDDLAYVEANRKKLGATQAVRFVEDFSVGRGGCLLKTEMGDVDARIEQQFAEIERAFIGS